MKIEDIALAAMDENVKADLVRDLTSIIEAKRNELIDYYSGNIPDLSTELPVGSIIASMLPPQAFAQEDSNSRWAYANGQNVSGSLYAISIGENVPDLRGLFLRGINSGRSDFGRDPGGERKAGNYQGDDFKSHNHTYVIRVDGYGNIPKAGNTGGPPSGYAGQTNNAGGAETRPKNIAVHYYVRIN